MKLKDFLKKLGVALEDKDTAEELKKFGIEAEHLEGFKDLTIPETLDEALKIKGVQSEFDKRLGKAADTREAKLKKKYGFGDQEEENEEEEEEIKTDDPAMKAMLKELKEMREWREKQEKAKAQETLEEKRTRAKEYLKSKGILPGYASELDLEKDFEEQFETVKTKFLADGGTISTNDPKKTSLGRLPLPKTGDDGPKPSKAEAEAFKNMM